jgi:hypothetical protein
VVTDVGHESAPTEWWPAPDELNPPLDSRAGSTDAGTAWVAANYEEAET